MNKIADMIAKGMIDPEDLLSAEDLLKRLKLVSEGLKACKKTLQFPMNVTEICCYQYIDPNHHFRVWGRCSSNGLFKCFCDPPLEDGYYKFGCCNLNDFESVLLWAFENRIFSYHLECFLKEQIEKAVS